MAQNVRPGQNGDVDGSQTSAKHLEDAASLKDNHAVAKRLQKELMNLMITSEKGITAFPVGDNIFKWVGTIDGPANTVYQHQKYKLSIDFPSSYPYAPPTVKFLTPCFHPNIDAAGFICLDILKEKWSALYDVRTLLLSIQLLLGDPNNDSPLNPQAAALWADQVAYKKHLDDFYQQHKDT